MQIFTKFWCIILYIMLYILTLTRLIGLTLTRPLRRKLRISADSSLIILNFLRNGRLRVKQ